MRVINSCLIRDTIEELFLKANCHINSDIENTLSNMQKCEKSPIGKEIIGEILENAILARTENMPICQDTGMAIVFLEIGQDVFIEGEFVEKAINDGVRNAYKKGYFRNSVLNDPIERINTGDNTPAIIHYSIIEGDKVNIHVAPKGFGSENMSKIKMCKPSEGREGIIDFVLNTVCAAGSNPCPPIVVGVGIGGSFEKVAYLAKKALLRSIDATNGNPFYEQMENELLEKINKLGIGPQGLGGTTTALGVNIETFPTHIAAMPVAVNISCHVTRHAQKTL